MERIQVASSSIASVGYEAAAAVLEIEFAGGAIYQYFGVPQDVYEELLNAASKGMYFHENIRRRGYSYAKVC